MAPWLWGDGSSPSSRRDPALKSCSRSNNSNASLHCYEFQLLGQMLQPRCFPNPNISKVVCCKFGCPRKTWFVIIFHLKSRHYQVSSTLRETRINRVVPMCHTTASTTELIDILTSIRRCLSRQTNPVKCRQTYRALLKNRTPQLSSGSCSIQTHEILLG